MTSSGWVLMLSSLSFVLCLVSYCFYRVLRTPVAKDHMHAPLDIDTHEKMG